MEDKGITVEELMASLQGDFREMAERIAQAINEAQPGRIIDDSEEPVRDANAEFRQRAFEQGLRLALQKREAFSPSAHSDEV